MGPKSQSIFISEGQLYNSVNSNKVIIVSSIIRNYKE